MVVAVFSLLSGGQSAPVDKCESLTQQLEIQAQDQVRPPSSALLYLLFLLFFVEFDFTWLRVRLFFSALGQVDCHRRKLRCPRIQTDDRDVCGQQLGESDSHQRKRRH